MKKMLLLMMIILLSLVGFSQLPTGTGTINSATFVCLSIDTYGGTTAWNIAYSNHNWVLGDKIFCVTSNGDICGWGAYKDLDNGTPSPMGIMIPIFGRVEGYEHLPDSGDYITYVLYDTLNNTYHSCAYVKWILSTDTGFLLDCGNYYKQNGLYAVDTIIWEYTQPINPNIINWDTYMDVVFDTIFIPYLYTLSPDIIDWNIVDNHLIYPNPAVDILNIETKEILDIVQVVDMTGKVLQTENVNSKNFELDVSSFSKGVYFVRFLFENGSVGTTKFMKGYFFFSPKGSSDFLFGLFFLYLMLTFYSRYI